MKLACINERKNCKLESAEADRAPLSFAEADALFMQGIKAMDAGENDEAFRMFDSLCQQNDGLPSEMVRAARAVRVWLDPDVGAEEKAATVFRLFKPTLIQVCDAKRDGQLHCC